MTFSTAYITLGEKKGKSSFAIISGSLATEFLANVEAFSYLPCPVFPEIEKRAQVTVN